MFWHTAQDKFIQQVFWFFSMKFSIRILFDLGFRWRHRSGNYNCTMLTWTTLLQWSGCLVFSFQSNYTLCQQKLTGSGGMELKIARSQTSSLTFRVVSGGSRRLQTGVQIASLACQCCVLVYHIVVSLCVRPHRFTRHGIIEEKNFLCFSVMW